MKKMIIFFLKGTPHMWMVVCYFMRYQFINYLRHKHCCSYGLSHPVYALSSISMGCAAAWMNALNSH